MDRGAWWATYNPWHCKESDATEQLTLSLSNSEIKKPEADCSLG